MMRARGASLVLVVWNLVAWIVVGWIVVVPPAAAQEAPRKALRVGLILPDAAAGGEGLRAAVLASLEQGATMAQEEFAFNAGMFETDFHVDLARADAAGAAAAAARLTDGGAVALIGALSDDGTAALGAWAAEQGVPFLDIGSSSDALRGCAATTFHVVPSAAMYLDALAGWYVRAGLRRWHFAQADTPEGEALYERASRALTERHFGAREVGRTVVAPEAGYAAAAAEIAESEADVVVLLLPAPEQLRALGAMEAAGLAVEATGFPYPETQTRAFFAASRAAAPRLGPGYRATDWEPSLDAYGARELNARFRSRFGAPMEGGAWAAYQGIKILYEAMLLGGSSERPDVLAYLAAPTSVFDVWKGIGTSFRPWDRQLRQPIYLVKIDEDGGEGVAGGLLVGELPAIYMPGTDPVERLDQLGDLAAQSECRP